MSIATGKGNPMKITHERYAPESNRSLADAVLIALDNHQDVELTGREPVYETVNLEAVDKVFSSKDPKGMHLSFDLPEVSVMLDYDDGIVRVLVADTTPSAL